MARAQWKGHLTFGLVNVPVELHGAVEDNTPRFRMLHKTDLLPIGMERVCQTDGEPVAREIKLALQLIEELSPSGTRSATRTTTRDE